MVTSILSGFSSREKLRKHLMGLDLIKPSQNECLLTKTKQQTMCLHSRAATKVQIKKVYNSFL